LAVDGLALLLIDCVASLSVDSGAFLLVDRVANVVAFWLTEALANVCSGPD
jgi:hypothetical protein